MSNGSTMKKWNGAVPCSRKKSLQDYGVRGRKSSRSTCLGWGGRKSVDVKQIQYPICRMDLGSWSVRLETIYGVEGGNRRNWPRVVFKERSFS